MSTHTYVDSVNSNLICCICRAPFIEPTSTTTCSHTFCRECITHAVGITPQCPVDRSALHEDDLCVANPIVRHLVDELIVECPQRPSGCLHTCQRQWLAIHLKDDCQYVKVACCQEQCEEFALRKDVRKHSDTCERRIVQCDACHIQIQAVDLQAHHAQCPAEDAICPHCESTIPRGDIATHASACPDFIITCEHAVHGCPWTGPRRVLSSSHLRRCPYEAIKGFFVLNASRISVLEAENSSLRERVEDLETALRSTKRDVQTARTALGPWFRPDGCRAPLRPSPPSEPAPRTYPRRRLSNALNSAMFGFPAESSPPTDAAIAPSSSHPHSLTTPPVVDAFSQFFTPPDSNISPTSYPSEHFMAPGQMTDGTYHRASLNSPVAPLSLNTTLESTLASLRSSIVTLASSLDSESRRHDIALTTETLRVNEEVMSLRAIVHGLRMQVHQIMMDRNSQVTGREDGDGVGYHFSHARLASAVEPWTSSVRYLNHNPPVHRPISIGTTSTTTHIQSTKL
ncbi:hypothetical protein K439DRAFT_1639971 [Ramaria rubella]|nr:hypothetical protein K439DRAFT_1639971 [Ramaria rubella]